MRKVCIITGSRAEFGLLEPLIKILQLDQGIDLQLIVTASHLAPEFGYTFNEIQATFKGTVRKVETLLSSDSSVGSAKSTGITVLSITDALADLSPDIIVVLGDRFEILGCTISACIMGIPIAHICGGEVTEGAFDECIRHSISKMANLHFPTTDQYKKRLLQLGEMESRVFNVGSLSIDNIKGLKLLSKAEIEREISLKLGSNSALVTFHPVTRDLADSVNQYLNLLYVLEERKDLRVVMTKPNADPLGRQLRQIGEEFAQRNSHRVKIFNSLGTLKYLSVMKYVDTVAGNSSSGIMEAPEFKIATINIGNRQLGRIMAESIINCEPTKEGIANAFAYRDTSQFEKKLHNSHNPYGRGIAAPQIAKILKELSLRDLTKKPFIDIHF